MKSVLFETIDFAIKAVLLIIYFFCRWPLHIPARKYFVYVVCQWWTRFMLHQLFFKSSSKELHCHQLRQVVLNHLKERFCCNSIQFQISVVFLR